MLCLVDVAINHDQTLAIYLRALHGNGTSCPASAEKHDPQISQIDGKLSSNGTRETNAIRVGSDEPSFTNSNRVDRTYLLRFFVDLVHQIDRGDLVRHGEINTGKFQLTDKIECFR